MDTVINWITQNLGEPTSLEVKLLATVVVFLAYLLARPLVMAIVGRRTQEATVLYWWRQATEYAALILVLFALSRIWLVGTQSLATYLGLLTAGLAIALQDPISNLFGWLFIIARRPFEIGDRIEIGGTAGDVVDIRYFQFTVMEIRNWVQADQSTGRVVHIPNKMVFSEELGNFHKGISYIWHELPVTITFESDWRKAKETLQGIADRQAADVKEKARARVRAAARRYMINYDNVTPIVYTGVSSYGVTLTVRYLCEPRQRRSTEEQLWEAILDSFAPEADLQFAYPTQRITLRPSDDIPPVQP